MFKCRNILKYRTTTSQISPYVNCKMDAQTSYPHFNWTLHQHNQYSYNKSHMCMQEYKTTSNFSGQKWTETEKNSLNRLKKLPIQTLVLRFYDLSLPLKLSVDSRLQVLVTFSCRKANQSIRLTRADQNPPNYAQIENETLAVVFGFEEFPQHVYGRTLEVETDHIPL